MDRVNSQHAHAGVRYAYVYNLGQVFKCDKSILFRKIDAQDIPLAAAGVLK